MRRIYKSISALLLTVIMVLSMCITAFAADSTVTYKGRKSGFEFAGETEFVYTATDLFDNFKGVMPGDTLTEKIKIENKYSGCDYIKVWLRAVLHDENGNPISPKVLRELKADMEVNEVSGMTELEYMNDFLHQLKLTVWNGEEIEKNRVYEGHPDELEKGFEDGNVYLGTIRYNKKLTLNAKLEVPIEMGNEYANRVGEVDWVFVIEERNDPSGGGGGGRPSPDRPEKVEVVEPIEPQAPAILPSVPKTGDETVMWPYILLLGLGVVGMVLTMFKKRKKKQ